MPFNEKINWYRHCGKQYRIASKNANEIPYDLPITHIYIYIIDFIYIKEKNLTLKEISSPLVKFQYITISKKQRQHKCLKLINGQRNTHRVKQYSALEKKKRKSKHHVLQTCNNKKEIEIQKKEKRKFQHLQQN